MGCQVSAVELIVAKWLGAQSGFVRGVAALVIVVTLPVPIDSARWWQSPRVIAALGLSRDQIASIERIHMSMYSEYLRRTAVAGARRAALNQVLASDAPEGTVIVAAFDAESAEAAASRARAQMLYRMYRVLSPKQRERCKTLARPSKWAEEPAGSTAR